MSGDRAFRLFTYELRLPFLFEPRGDPGRVEQGALADFFAVFFPVLFLAFCGAVLEGRNVSLTLVDCVSEGGRVPLRADTRKKTRQLQPRRYTRTSPTCEQTKVPGLVHCTNGPDPGTWRCRFAQGTVVSCWPALPDPRTPLNLVRGCGFRER